MKQKGKQVARIAVDRVPVSTVGTRFTVPDSPLGNSVTAQLVTRACWSTAVVLACVADWFA
jgi:hypothetical protein